MKLITYWNMLKNPQLMKTVKSTVITKKRQLQLPPITQPQSNVSITQDEIGILKLGLFRPNTETEQRNWRIFFNLPKNYDWPTITKTRIYCFECIVKLEPTYTPKPNENADLQLFVKNSKKIIYHHSKQRKICVRWEKD